MLTNDHEWWNAEFVTVKCYSIITMCRYSNNSPFYSIRRNLFSRFFANTECFGSSWHKSWGNRLGMRYPRYDCGITMQNLCRDRMKNFYLLFYEYYFDHRILLKFSFVTLLIEKVGIITWCQIKENNLANRLSSRIRRFSNHERGKIKLNSRNIIKNVSRIFFYK